MLDKIRLTLTAMLLDLKKIKSDILSLQDQPTPKDGVSPCKDDIVADVLAKIPKPKDGESPKPEDIVEVVLKRLPAPKDGESPDVDAVAFKVLSQMPKPKDAEPLNIDDVVSAVIKRIPAPEKAPCVDLKAIARDVIAQIPAHEAAKPVKQPTPVKGKDGKSITKVKLEKGNQLAVWIDGIRRVVGKIELPKAPMEAFTPGGGGHKAKLPDLSGTPVEQHVIGTFDTTETQEPTGSGVDGVIQIHFGDGGVTENGEFTVDSDGTITCNKNSVQYHFETDARFRRSGQGGVSDLIARMLYAEDGESFVQIGNTFGARVDDADTVWRESYDIKFSPAVGSKIKFEFGRDEDGNNSGEIGTFQPTDTLSGWNPVHSAQLVISKTVIQ